MNIFYKFLTELMSHPFDPERRFFWGAVLSSLIIGWLILLSQKGFSRTNQIFRQQLFSREIWLHPSSILDLKLFLFNSFVRLFWAGLFISFGYSFSLFILKMLRELTPDFHGLNLSKISSLALYTLFFFVIDDFARFIHHFLMHKIKFLKHFHRTHHSAQVLTPLTLHRAHTFEIFLAECRNFLVHSFSLVVSVYFFPFEVAAIDFLGVNIFGILFNLMASNLRHSQIPVGFGILELIFISPNMHQIHHSNNPVLMEKNYGVSLSVWDQLAGSFYRPDLNEKKTISFGLGQFVTNAECTSLKEALMNPIRDAILIRK